jgi:hypothetical protein
MKKTLLGLAAAALLAGAAGNWLGANRAAAAARLDGRLSACQEIFSVIGPSMPIPLECTVIEGEVYITTPLAPDFAKTLDGRNRQ